MGFVEQMRWWQWVIISLLVGAALGYINQQGKEPPAEHRSVDTGQFERELAQGLYRGKIAFINNLVIYPPHEDKKRGGMVQLATYMEFVPTDEREPIKQVYMLAPYPYEVRPYGVAQRGEIYPGADVYTAQKGDTLQSVVKHFYGKFTPQGRSIVLSANRVFREAESNDQRQIVANNSYFIPWNPSANHSLQDFVDAANKTYAANKVWHPITYRYVWWQSPQYAYRIWMIGSFVILGVIWPLLLHMMLLGGLGRVSGEEYDLNRFKGAKEQAPAPKPSTAMTIDDYARLEQMEASLRASLGPSTPGEPAAAGAAGAAAKPAIKDLSSHAEKPKDAPKTEEQAKDYRGEFYPVAKSGEKKDKKA